jgi:hypothetical protein
MSRTPIRITVGAVVVAAVLGVASLTGAETDSAAPVTTPTVATVAPPVVSDRNPRVPANLR